MTAMKKIILLCLFSGFVANAFSQVLFTYGDKSVEAAEFLRAFNKNNQATGKEREKAMQDYLQLYINSRLKIEEAHRRGYDTLTHILNEVGNLRTQISENYMNDPSAIDRLAREAFVRSQKDIRVSHIFISFQDAGGQYQKDAADKKRDLVLSRLKAGEDFSKIAAEFSDDPEAKLNKGDLGFITVFTLPYEIENVIYQTPKGKYSDVVHSKAGYHIFKTVSDRKAAGKMKAQQILLAYPPNADEQVKKNTGRLADSLYKRLLAGDDFGKLATSFSNDYISAAAGGAMSDISVGQYDAKFESMLWSLPKDGAISKPFQTSHGWHIVKRVSIKPVNTDSNARAAMADLRSRIMQDGRWKSSRDFIYDQVKQKAGVKKFSFDEQALWAWADSMMDHKPMTAQARSIGNNTPLFSIGETTYTAGDWLSFALSNRYRKDGSGIMPHEMVRDEFQRTSMVNYYRDHLEEFNPEFKAQMNEFRDGNLFFEIMQNEIWNKAQMDTAALASHYTANSQKYMWEKSVDAILFFCSDETAAKLAHAEMKKDPMSWRSVVEKNAERVVADSSRFEFEQIPNLGKINPKAGMLTDPFINETDKSASFAYILRVNDKPLQRSFSEARGMVINDYQAILEEQWNKKLREKYPVRINDQVFATILAGK
jgi:peptidyl-prolyl cis-trans isomerase SurA